MLRSPSDLSTAAIVGFTAIAGMLLVCRINASDHDEIHACVSPGSGHVRILGTNETCRSGETPLVWNGRGLQGPPGPQGPEGPAGAQGVPGPTGPPGMSFVVVDSLGQEVGPLLPGGSSGALVLRRLGSTSIGLPVSENGFQRSADLLYYETNDCTGVAFFGQAFILGGLVRVANILGHAAVWSEEPARNIVFRSRKLVHVVGDTEGICTPDPLNNTSVFASPTVSMDLRELNLKPPFSIRWPSEGRLDRTADSLTAVQR